MKKHSVIYSWVISYILLLVMIILLCFSMERFATKKLVEEYKEISGTLLEQANESLYDHFEKMQSQSVELCSDTGVVSYALSTQPGGANYYNMVLLQERLQNQMLMAKDEMELYLYLKNADKAISPYTIYDRDSFYGELTTLFDIDEEQYEEILNRRYCSTILAFDSKDGEGKTVAMLTSIPMTGSSVRGMFLQVLDHRILKEILESRTVLADSTLVLMDGDGRILCSSGDKKLAESIPTADIAEISNCEIEINGEVYWVSFEHMKTEGWQLITLVPMKSIVQKTEWVSRIMVPILCIALLIGIVLSIGSVCINYLPLRKLSMRFSRGQQYTDSKNEFERISFAFQDMYENMESMRVLQNEQAEQLKLEFLRFCLENSIDLDESSMLKIIEKLGVKIHNGCFLVGIFDVSTGDNAQIFPMTDVLDIFSQLFSGQDFSCHGSFSLLVKNEQPILLFYMKEETQEESLRSLLKEKLRMLAEQYHWGFIFALSSVHQGFSEMHLAYLEACELLDYKHFKYGRAANGEETESDTLPEYGQMHYSAVQEELLMRYMLAGNREDALELLGIICRHNFQEQMLSLPVACCLMEDIVLGMMKTLSEERCLDTENMDKIGRTLDQIRKVSSRESLVNLVSTLTVELTDYCGRIRAQKKTSRNLPVEKIMNCVEEHFREYDFNVSKAAEYLDMNMTYLSRYFKEHTGIGLLNYINGVRINYAKQLMSEQNITVAEAARMAGFENQNTFIRLFKKFEGKTPGLFLDKE